MGIPDYQSLMLPLLELAGDQQEHSIRQAVDALANRFGLTDADRRELLSSGRQRTFDNRVGWARTYLGKAGLLESLRRGVFRITSSGMQVISAPPAINRYCVSNAVPRICRIQGSPWTIQHDNGGPGWN